MKILLVTHFLPYPPKGGATLRNYNLLKEAAAQHDIYMLTFYQSTDHRDEDALMDAVEEIRKLCRHLEVFPIPSDGSRFRWWSLLLFNLFSPTPYSAWRFSSRKMSAAIERLLNEHTFDLMELGTIALGRFGRVAPALPKVLVHHNIESELLLRRSRYLKNPLARLYVRYQARKLRRFERQIASTIDCHTTCSAQDRDLLLENCPAAQVEIVPNGVDTGYFRATGDPTVADRFVYVGGMTWFPNRDAVEYFIDDIWPLIKRKLPNATFVHIGREATGKSEDTAREDPSIRFLGFVEDIRREVCRSSVYVVPLRIGGGTRLKILDALAMGCAIVSTSVGCEGIEVTDGQDILIADDPDTFAQKVIQLCRDQELRERLKAKARKTALERYSWKIVAPKLESVYRQVSSGGDQPD